jgi:hypothetical protein
MKANGGTAAPRPPVSEHNVKMLSHFPEVCESSIEIFPLPQDSSFAVRDFLDGLAVR